MPEDWQASIEQFVCFMYARSNPQENVNLERRHLFTKRAREIRNIPPTSNALLQHIKRAAYQAGHIWASSLVAYPSYPSPECWGWVKDDTGCWQPLWTTLPPAVKSCRQLIKCGCKKECKSHCRCTKASLNCTALCSCQCEQSING